MPAAEAKRIPIKRSTNGCDTGTCGNNLLSSMSSTLPPLGKYISLRFVHLALFGASALDDELLFWKQVLCDHCANFTGLGQTGEGTWQVE